MSVICFTELMFEYERIVCSAIKIYNQTVTGYVTNWAHVEFNNFDTCEYFLILESRFWILHAVQRGEDLCTVWK